jgi:TRAP-type C4-dicarboxylate transport system substrate-binding protein
LNKSITSAAGLLFTVVLIAGCASTGAGTPSPVSSGDAGFDDVEPITLTVSAVDAESSASAAGLKALAAEVEEKTDGKVTFEFFWAGSLHAPLEALTALESGITDITFVTAAYFPDELPVANWLAAIGTTNQSDAWPLAMPQAVGAMIEQYETNEDLRKEYGDLGAVPLLETPSTQFDILCTKPVSTLDQASGTLIRTPGEPWLGEATALGMTQVSVAYAELYEATQRGLIECSASVPSGGFIPTGLWDIAQEYTPLGMSGTASGVYLMNKDLWEGLPAQVQEVINEAKPIFSRIYTEESLNSYATWAKEGPAKGVKFLDGAELREVINDHQEELRDSLVDNAPAGVSDPQATYDSYVSSLDEWLAASEEDFGIAADPLPDDEDGIIETYLAVTDLDYEPFAKRLHEQMQSFAE